MAKGSALCIGLNSVDPGHYAGWSGPLNACEADADDMANIADSRKFGVTKLLTRAATRQHVIDQISSAASTLVSGDIFLLTYSGHGGQLPDRSGDERDAQDETWCLYDGELVDDELYSLLGRFAQGVRVFVLSDSCHSGSVVKLAYYGLAPSSNNTSTDDGGTVYRFMPGSVALRTYRNNRAFYDPILQAFLGKRPESSVKASVLLISGCQDNQLSADGDFNGLFTARLLQVWNEGQFNRDYSAFHRAITRLMPPRQTPNYFRTGRVSASFERQQPFSI